MMVQELETISRLKLSPLFLVLCDRSLAVIKIAQKAHNYTPHGVDFLPVDWPRVAEGFGISGAFVSSLDEIQKKIANWLESPEPTVLALPIDETLYLGLNY